MTTVSGVGAGLPATIGALRGSIPRGPVDEILWQTCGADHRRHQLWVITHPNLRVTVIEGGRWEGAFVARVDSLALTLRRAPSRQRRRELCTRFTQTQTASTA